MLFAN